MREVWPGQDASLMTSGETVGGGRGNRKEVPGVQRVLNRRGGCRGGDEGRALVRVSGYGEISEIA